MIPILNRVLDTLYPPLCLICKKEYKIDPSEFCLSCQLTMPYTDHYENPANAMMHHFWGRVEIEMGAALFDFKKQHLVRDLVHRFKYQNEQRIGGILGNMAGQKILKSSYFDPVDLVVPVPSTKWKKWKKGYNQAELFGRGIADFLHIKCESSHLLKVRSTPSQTRKNRIERIENVSNSFQVIKEPIWKHKHLLLVDDVLTTGATVIACAQVLRPLGCKISVATIGLAH